MRTKLGIILGLAAVIIGAIPTIAAAYVGLITVSNNSTTAYAMFPAIASTNVSYMASMHFINSTGNDTRVQSGGSDIPFMLANDKILSAAPLPALSNQQYQFLTGQNETATFPIITGYGGYVTTVSSANLDPNSSANVTFDNVYLGTTGNLTLNNYSLKVDYNSITGNATATAFGVPSSAYFTAAAGVGWNNPNNAIDGNTSTYADTSAWGAGGTSNYLTISGANVTTSYLRYWMLRNGNTSNVRIEAYDGASWNVVFTGLPTQMLQWAYVEFARQPVQQVRINASDDGTGSAFIRIYEVQLAQTAVVSRHISQAEHDVSVVDDATNFSIIVDGLAISTGNLTMWNSSSNWTWLSNIPYASSISYSVNGTQQLLYQPNDIISGANLPDRGTDAVTNNGTITWGSNPSGVLVALSGFAPSESMAVVTISTNPQDVVPIRSENTTNINLVPKTAASPTNPLSTFITIMSGSNLYDMPELFLWIFIAFMCSMISFALVLGMFNHLGAAGMTASVVWGLFVVMHVLPWSFLAASVVGFLVGLVQEIR